MDTFTQVSPPTPRASLFFLVRATCTAQPLSTIVTIFGDELPSCPLIPLLCFLPSFAIMVFLLFAFYFPLFSCDVFGRLTVQSLLEHRLSYMRASLFSSLVHAHALRQSQIKALPRPSRKEETRNQKEVRRKKKKRYSKMLRYSGAGVHPASCKMGTGSFPGVKCGQGALLTTHPLLVPWS